MEWGGKGRGAPALIYLLISGCLMSDPKRRRRYALPAHSKSSTAGDEGTRLHDIDLAFHVGPFDVLFFLTKNALNARRGRCEPAYDVVSQHHAISGDRNFFDAAAIIKRQQTIFRRTRQHAHRLTANPENNLFGD